MANNIWILQTTRNLLPVNVLKDRKLHSVVRSRLKSVSTTITLHTNKAFIACSRGKTNQSFPSVSTLKYKDSPDFTNGHKY